LVNDEWEKIEKEVFVAKLKYCLGIWLGGLSKATKYLSWVIPCHVRDLNRSSSENTTVPSPFEPTDFVLRKGTLLSARHAICIIICLCPYHEGMWREKSYAPLIHNLGTKWTWVVNFTTPTGLL
jgi:hypothetical protein